MYQHLSLPNLSAMNSPLEIPLAAQPSTLISAADGLTDADITAAIETLLATARSHYQGGMTDAANEAVISAYLDHFEQLERPLAAKNKALELKIEETLKNGLRALIRQKVTPVQFCAALDATMKDLATAKGLLQ